MSDNLETFFFWPRILPKTKRKHVAYSICELRKKIRTRTCARTLARVRCACETRFEMCVRCACVRGLEGTSELRSQLCNYALIELKSILPKKATKIDKIFTIDLTLTT